MKTLTLEQCQFVSGATDSPFTNPLLYSIIGSYFSAIGGGVGSGIYAIATQTSVTTTVGTVTTISSSFVPTFWMGLGMSWALGAIVGAAYGYGVYLNAQEAHNP